MRTKPFGYNTSALVTTAGLAFALPTTKAARQVKVYVSALAYVGFGTSSSPTAISASSEVVYQEASTEVVYTLDGVAALDGSHIWVYGVAGTITARVSFLG